MRWGDVSRDPRTIPHLVKRRGVSCEPFCVDSLYASQLMRSTSNGALQAVRAVLSGALVGDAARLVLRTDAGILSVLDNFRFTVWRVFPRAPLKGRSRSSSGDQERLTRRRMAGISSPAKAASKPNVPPLIDMAGDVSVISSGISVGEAVGSMVDVGSMVGAALGTGDVVGLAVGSGVMLGLGETVGSGVRLGTIVGLTVGLGVVRGVGSGVT